MTLYYPFEQVTFGGHRSHQRRILTLLVKPITGVVRDMSTDQPLERAATLADVRAEVLTPDRLNTLVFGGFSIVALTIAGPLPELAAFSHFSGSARARANFGIRLAIGAQPRQLLAGVIVEGAIPAGRAE